MSAQPIETQRLDIVPLDPHRDAARLHTIRSQYEVWSNMGQNEPSSVPNPDGMRSEMEKNGGWNWVIRLKETQEVIGSVSLNPGGAIRGMAWYLDPVYWGQGLMSEAVSSVVENLLGTRTFHGLEAWINSDNRPSIAVARNAGMTERGRMPIYYKTREMPHQNVVMGRAAGDTESNLMSLRPVLEAKDVKATVDLLSGAIGLHTEFMFGDPPTFAGMTLSPFTGGQGIYISASDDPDSVAKIVLLVDGNVDERADMAMKVGLDVDGPHDDPSHRSYIVKLPEGHELRLRGVKYPGLRQMPEENGG